MQDDEIQYVSCASCGRRVRITSGGRMHKHDGATRGVRCEQAQATSPDVTTWEIAYTIKHNGAGLLAIVDDAENTLAVVDVRHMDDDDKIDAALITALSDVLVDTHAN